VKKLGDEIVTGCKMEANIKKMRDAGAQFKVPKNSLALIALADTRYKQIGDLLSEPTALATSADPVASAKVAVDFAKTPEDRRVMELVYSSQTFGRPYMLPPGVPMERVAALRRAFLDTMRDNELLAEARKIGIVIDPISGEELQALARSIYATPANIVEQARQAVSYRGP